MENTKCRLISTHFWSFSLLAVTLIAFGLYFAVHGYHLGGQWLIPSIVLGAVSLLALLVWLTAAFWQIYKKYTVAALFIAIITAPVVVLVIFGVGLFVIQNK